MALIKDEPEHIGTTDELAKTVQGALIEAAWVKFAGSSVVALDDPPELDESRVYIVKATCRKRENTLRKDHEERLAVTMEIDSCYERGKVPIVDEDQPSLFADPDPGEDEGESGIDLSGVDRPSFSDDDHVVDCEVVDDEDTED